MTIEVKREVDQEVERYMALPYRIELIPDKGGFVMALEGVHRRRPGDPVLLITAPHARK